MNMIIYEKYQFIPKYINVRFQDHVDHYLNYYIEVLLV